MSFAAYPTRYKLDAKTKALIERANKGDAEALRLLASQSKGYQEAVGSAGRKLSSGERKYRNEQVWRETLTSGKHLLCEVLPIYDSYRLVTGKDPVIGKQASRLEAGFWLGLEALPYVSKVAKTRKAAKAAEKADDVARAGSRVSKNIADDILRDGSHFDEFGNLKPNVRYQSGEFEYLYHTDKVGRLTEWDAKELQLTTRDKRLPHASSTPGKLKGDHAGHLAGDRFGGSPEIDNLVSQLNEVNLSDYKKLENSWAKALEEGKDVSVNVKVNYVGDSLRPSSFDVTYKINGKISFRNIPNN